MDGSEVGGGGDSGHHVVVSTKLLHLSGCLLGEHSDFLVAFLKTEGEHVVRLQGRVSKLVSIQYSCFDARGWWLCWGSLPVRTF